jgi:mannose-6-phosphate isomerase-like protein (cupin superfamily)
MKGFVTDIEKETFANEDFRRVLYTSKHQQLVVMSIVPGQEIGEETHADVDQFLRVEMGTGKAILNGVEHEVSDGFSITVPAGVKHNLINTSQEIPLKLYTVYSPPNHKDGLVHKTKEEADADEPNDHWDGSTTE